MGCVARYTTRNGGQRTQRDQRFGSPAHGGGPGRIFVGGQIEDAVFPFGGLKALFGNPHILVVVADFDVLVTLGVLTERGRGLGNHHGSLGIDTITGSIDQACLAAGSVEFHLESRSKESFGTFD